MNLLGPTFRRTWGVPLASGALIVAALVAGALAGDAAAGLSLRDVLMIAAALVAGAPIALKALRALQVGVVGIDLLVSVAATGAIVIGEHWEAAAVTFLFALGAALEAATMDRTRAALGELLALAPDEAVVLRDDEQRVVPAAEVRLGETVLVKAGAKVPVDGEVIGGSGAIDEASITGESLPVEKSPGAKVYAGTIATGGFLQVRALGVGADTTLARIVHRVEEAQDDKAKTQRFIDRFSRWYTPGIIVLSLAVGLATKNVELALTLLVISCPGALVISIPVSIVAGIGRAAKDGILIKGGEFLETAARVTAVAFDKTGTLTWGRPRVERVVPLAPGVDERQVLGWAAQAELGSDHPLARPVLAAARAAGVDPEAGGQPENVEAIPGEGVVAEVDGERVLVGNLRLLERHRVAAAGAAELATELAAAGLTPMLVAVGEQVLGAIGVADEIRPHAAATVSALRHAGVKTALMLTGDAEPVAAAVAQRVGIEDHRAGLLPEDKLVVIHELQTRGHVVAMVGDGVNDAPALATADVGVALGAAASAVAVETADIAILGDDLRKLSHALSLARRTAANMRQNVVVAIATVLALLAGVLFGGVTMAVGMLVHEGSVLLVIVNAMRLLRPVRVHEGAGAGAPTPAPARPQPLS